MTWCRHLLADSRQLGQRGTYVEHESTNEESQASHYLYFIMALRFARPGEAVHVSAPNEAREDDAFTPDVIRISNILTLREGYTTFLDP